MKRYVLIIGILSLTGYGANAQILKPVSIEYMHNRAQQKGLQRLAFPNENMFCASVLPPHLTAKLSFKYELPKGAIFCRMEDAIYNKLNFWVKFRMGTDEKYSN